MDRTTSPIEKVLSYDQCPDCDTDGESRNSGGYRCPDSDCNVATFRSDGTVVEINLRAEFDAYTRQTTVNVEDDTLLQKSVRGDFDD